MSIEINDLDNVGQEVNQITDLSTNEIEVIHIDGVSNIPLIKGDVGEKGETGPANCLQIGIVEEGDEASATITGETPNQILNLILPRGEQGEKGEQGIQGEKGEPGATYDDTEVRNKIISITQHIYQLKITSNINAGAEVTLPCYYQVGQEVLDVYLDTERLALSSDDAGTDGHYREIGDADSISNKIKTTTDWQLETGDILTLVVRGEYNANT